MQVNLDCNKLNHMNVKKPSQSSVAYPTFLLHVRGSASLLKILWEELILISRASMLFK